jgi:hypothetical protein
MEAIINIKSINNGLEIQNNKAGYINMNLKISYLYLRSQGKKNVVDSTLLSFICILIWFCSIIYLINIIFFNRSQWAEGPFIFSFGSAIVAPIAISLFFPFGRGSISITDNMIQFIPIRLLFNILIPIKKSVILSKPVIVNYNKHDNMISIIQDSLDENICIYGIDDRSKNQILAAFRDIALKNKNFKFND